MSFTFVRLFGDHGEEVKIGGRYFQTDFFLGFADRAFERRLADRGLEFTTDGTPNSEIRWLGAQEEQVFARGIFEKNEDSDFVGERSGHAAAQRI